MSATAGLELVQTNKGAERTWQRSRLRNSPIVLLKDYDVFAVVDGQRVKLGRVYQGLATMERKTPGRKYVNSRWRSPRWYFDVEQGCRYYRLRHSSRKEACRQLAAAFHEERRGAS